MAPFERANVYIETSWDEIEASFQRNKSFLINLSANDSFKSVSRMKIFQTEKIDRCRAFLHGAQRNVEGLCRCRIERD